MKCLAMHLGLVIIVVSPQGLRVHDNVKWVLEGPLTYQRLVNPHHELCCLSDGHTVSSLEAAGLGPTKEGVVTIYYNGYSHYEAVLPT